MSPQYSLFWNEEIVDSRWNEQWNCEYHFRNKSNNLEFLIGGNQDIGVIHYIEWLGFFEGGHPDNMYRLDPFVVMGCLTGIIQEDTIRIFSEQFQARIDRLRDEIRQTQEANKENSQELVDWVRIQSEKITQQEIEMQHQILALRQLVGCSNK